MIIPILTIALLPMAFLCRKDKKMFWILWVFMAITMVMNTYNLDWNAYKFMYGQIDCVEESTLTDVGYGILNYVANVHLQLNFFQFRAVFTFVGMILVACVIVKYTTYPAMVLALYFIAPFFPNDIIQIRNFMAQAILVYFGAKWIESEKRNVLWLLIGIALATTMHAATIYFIVFILLYFVKDEQKLYIGVIVGSFLVGSLPLILSKIPFVSSEKISYYLGSTLQGIDVRGLIIIIVFLVQLYMLYKIKCQAFEMQNPQLIKWTDLVYKMNVLCLPACVIMTVWTFNFYRIPRNMLLMNYIVYAKYLVERKEKKRLNFKTLILIVSGFLWSALNSFSQWSVIWNNNAFFIW